MKPRPVINVSVAVDRKIGKGDSKSLSTHNARDCRLCGVTAEKATFSLANRMDISMTLSVTLARLLRVVGGRQRFRFPAGQSDIGAWLGRKFKRGH